MTEYQYRWISAILCGEPDTAAAEKALKKGWEPVDVVPPEIEPLTGLTMEQTLRGMALYRMPKEKHDGIRAELAALNRGLAGRFTPSLMLTYKTSRAWPAIGTIMQPRIVDEDTGEELSPEIRLDEDILTGAKLAYEWLSAQGLS